MKEIRIFVASSWELHPDRNLLAYLTVANEEAFARRGFRVSLAKWEYVDPSMTPDMRTEDRYLAEMHDSDAVLVLFKNLVGTFTNEEMETAIAAEKAGNSRLKAHRILFRADSASGSTAERLRDSLSPDSYGTYSNDEELEKEFLSLVDKVSQSPRLNLSASEGCRNVTAFLASDEELKADRNALSDAVLELNNIFIRGNYRVALRFCTGKTTSEERKLLVESSKLGLALYGTNANAFGEKDVTAVHERCSAKKGSIRFYAFFQDGRESEIDKDFREFRDSFEKKFQHFVCWFGSFDALGFSFSKSVLRYISEKVKSEIYSTVRVPTASTFVGRESELETLCTLFSVSSSFPAGRFPVITGDAGTGKSELVRQFAVQFRAQYPGGLFQADMEHVKSWDGAFRAILGETPNNGVSVRECLKLKVDQDDDERRPVAGTDIRNALLRRAREKGPILLVLDNVEEWQSLLGQGGGLSDVFPAGFSERVLVNVVATTRVCNVVLRPEDWAKLVPLGDFTPDEALDFLFKVHPPKDGPEREAAARVAKLLGCRALYLRCVSALIGDRWRSSINSFADLEKELNDNYLKTINAGTAADHWPEALWKTTCDRLLGLGAFGNACIKLAQAASFFSPDNGCPRHVLAHVWKTFSSPKDPDKREFDRAVELLHWCNVFQSVDPMRIHRVVRAAILQTAKAKHGVEESLGAVLSDYGLLMKEEWIALYEHKGVGIHLPVPLARDADFWVGLLVAFPKFASYCPWNDFDGVDWCRLLCIQPHLACHCKWERLNGGEWSELLCVQPRFSDYCSWEKLDELDWERLLRIQPQFAKHCDWEKLRIEEWSRLLGALPQLVVQRPYGKLCGYEWAFVLRARPQLAKCCSWEKLCGTDWSVLLQLRPEFAYLCPWDELDGDAWSELLCVQPEFSKYCKWEKLDEWEWCKILCAQSQFDELCPWEKLGSWCWDSLLKKRPELIDFCSQRNFDGVDWGWLLMVQPQLVSYCPVEKLDGGDWARLLCCQPQFENRCAWEKLSGEDWCVLLCDQPQFIDRCPLEKLSGSDWSRLLCCQPQFAVDCSWEKMNGGDWVCLVLEQPQFVAGCPWDKLEGSAWRWLLMVQPQFADRCSWDKLDSWDWRMLLCEQPQFGDLCPWEQLKDDDLFAILHARPQFAEKWSLEKLDGEFWSGLLCCMPKFARRCIWEKFDGSNWASLLSVRPQFSNLCQWGKLRGSDWSLLLSKQPQFSDICPWGLLDGFDWRRLLESQSQAWGWYEQAVSHGIL